MEERPDYPDAYLKLHDIYFDQGKWEKAYEWGKQGLIRPAPRNFCLVDPSAYGWRPTLSMAFTLFQMNKFEEALKLFNEAKKDVPTLDFIKENEKLFKTAVEHNRFMTHYLAVLNYLREKGEELKIKDLLNAAPKELEENEIIIKLKQNFFEIKEWSDKSVCIFAITSLPDWSPKSVEKGIGGSEEAVIYLSKELVKQGWEVTVFNNCGEQAGIYDGVEYKDIVHLNPNDNFNIFISWRTNVFESNLKAQKRIVWLHDLPYLDLSDDRLKKIDSVVVLSQYHKSLLPKNVPEEKIFVSTNGILPEDFNGLNETREPHRIIYASSYNRGLEQLLEKWVDIRKEVPDATIHTYYGWETYDAFVKDGQLKDNGFKAKMLKLMSQEGVTDHGRIGHKELAKEYAKASIFAYPCSYEGEINCIALTKAIVSGCKVITNKFAVMAERSPLAVDDNDFKDKLIGVLNNGTSVPESGTYLQKNSWESVAKSWIKNLFIPNNPPVLYKHRIQWILDSAPEGKKIVDLGCNSGFLFEKYDRTNITSVDIDKYDLPNFVRADITKPLPFSDKQFEIAVLGDVVEHTKNPVDVIKEAMRISKELLITVPYEHKWASFLHPCTPIEEALNGRTMEQKAIEDNPDALEIVSEDNYYHLHHHIYYTPETFEADIRKAGIDKFQIIEMRGKDMVWLGARCG